MHTANLIVLLAGSALAFPQAPCVGCNWNATSSPSPVATTSQSALPTWHVDVEVGLTKIPIGDTNVDSLLGLMQSGCPDPMGCNNSPQSIDQFLYIGNGNAEEGSGSITMEGNVDNDYDVVTALLASINTAIQKSADCSTQTGTCCPGAGRTCPSQSKKRDPQCFECEQNGSNEGGNCISGLTGNQCSIVSWVQATGYSGESKDGSQMNQITFSAGTQLQGEGFDCAALQSILNGITPVLPPGIPVVLNGITTACENPS